VRRARKPVDSPAQGDSPVEPHNEPSDQALNAAGSQSLSRGETSTITGRQTPEECARETPASRPGTGNAGDTEAADQDVL